MVMVVVRWGGGGGSDVTCRLEQRVSRRGGCACGALMGTGRQGGVLMETL